MQRGHRCRRIGGLRARVIRFRSIRRVQIGIGLIVGRLRRRSQFPVAAQVRNSAPIRGRYTGATIHAGILIASQDYGKPH
jgi:hypothetical protein